MKNKKLYKMFQISPSKAKPGDLLRAASKRKSEGRGWPKMRKSHKKASPQDQSLRTQSAIRNFSGKANYAQGNNSTQPFANPMMGNQLAKKISKKHKSQKKSIKRESPVGSLTAKRMNEGGRNAKKLGDQAEKFGKTKKMKTMCKVCAKSHEKGKHKAKGK